MSDQKILLFDIDYTLVDTWKILAQVKDEFQKILKISNQEYDVVHDSYYATLSDRHDFDPSDYIQTFVDRFNAEKERLLQVAFESTIYRNSLYNDVVPTLTKLTESHTLGIFSEGLESFQTAKLEHSNIDHFFLSEHRYIYRRKCEPDSLQHLPNNSIIIDDSVRVMDELAGKQNLQLIWLNRDGKEARPELQTIISLADLVNL